MNRSSQSPLKSNGLTPRRLPMCILVLLLLGAGSLAQTPKIEITQPKDPSKPASVQESLRISFKVTNASNSRIRIRVDGDQDVVTSNEIALTSEGEHVISVNLFKGANHITLIGFVNDVPSTTLAPRIEAICDTRWCKDYFSLKPENVASEYKETPTAAASSSTAPKTGQQSDDSKGAIHIENPDPQFANHYQNGVVKFKIKVDANDDASKNVKALYVRVLNGQKPVVQTTKDLEVKFAAGSKSAELTPAVTLAAGANEVTVFEPGNFDAQRASITVWCDACDKVGESTASTTPPQEGSIKISGPKSIQADQKEAKITVITGKKEDTAAKTVMVEVTNNDQPVPQDPAPTIAVDRLGKPVEFTVKTWKGLNKVTIFEVNKKDTDHDSAEITCKENCGTKDPVLITIDSPTPDATFPTSFYTASLTVAKAPTNEIKKLKYYVLHNKTEVVDPRDVDAVDVTYNDKGLGKVAVPIKFVQGKNEVFFFDPEHDDPKYKASVIVNCAGEKCATDFLVATIATNSMTTRAIVGMEQVGASSASSEIKPFLDFFFTGGLKFDTLKKNGVDVKDRDGKPVKVPRFGTWGQIRLSTTPQQTATAAVFPSNFVNQVTDPTKVVALVQSFDFLGGVEARAFSANGWNWTLVPGVKQKSRFYITLGGGAISPLSAERTAAQIFKIPSAATATTPASSQRALFVARFGEPPAGKTYVGFVPLERDRFFRQYYFGIRVKTHYCDDDDCTRFKNRFPSIIDFALGQNEAVTGGRFHRDEDGKRAWVVRLDAFYPLPFREASFLYLYGTAMLKVFYAKSTPGEIPLFLDTAPGEVQITGTDVFIPSATQQPSRLNRDYYKIGIGVNLTDLFNRNKTPPN